MSDFLISALISLGVSPRGEISQVGVAEVCVFLKDGRFKHGTYCNLATTNSTFLFGYSTATDPNVVREIKQTIVRTLSANPRRFVKFADVRFDCKNGSTIFYHDDISSFAASVDAHPADDSLTNYGNNTDIVQVIDSFNYNTQIPRCGSTMLFLMKRFSLTRYFFTHFGKMKQEKMMVHCIQTRYRRESAYLGTMNDVSGNTGGIYAITGSTSANNDPSFTAVAEKIMGVPYHGNLIYNVYPGRTLVNISTQLENLKIPEYKQKCVNLTLVMTSQIYEAFDPQSIELTLLDKSTNIQRKILYNQNNYFSESDLIWQTIPITSGSEYYVYMNFRTQSTGYVAIRMYIDETYLDLKGTD